jgi:hypothetical protein
MAVTVNDVRITCDAYMIFDTGKARMQGLRYSENDGIISAVYDGVSLPYIHYQETGFTHWISGRQVEVNKGYISNDTTNALSFLVNNATTAEKSVIMASNKRTVQARNNQMSQGVLQSLKGNENRGGNGVLIG